MANRKQQPVYEEQAETNGGPLLKVLIAVACFGLAVLMIYMAVAQPQSGTSMGPIRDVMRGVGGSLFPLLSLMLVWIGVLLVFSARGKRIRIINVIMNFLLFICAFTAVQLFCVRTIIETQMSLTTFATFVVRSYQSGTGGGALGALLAYPLYIYVGQWGGLIVVLLAAVLSLITTGRAQKFYRWTLRRAEAGQHHMEQKRNQRNVERLFDYNSNDYDEYDGYVNSRPIHRESTSRPRPDRANRPSQPARRPNTPNRDYMVIDTPAPAPKRKPRANAASPKKKLYKENID